MSEELRSELMELGKQGAISIGLFVIGLLLGGNISQAFMVACVPYGWRILNRITPNFFIWMPWIGWFIYFIVKVTASAVVGVFALAYIWLRCIIRVLNAYKKQA